MESNSTMIDYVPDDGGRADAGRKGQASDCVVRAIAIVTGTLYADAYRRVGDLLKAQTGSRSIGRGVPKKVRDRLYREFGLVRIRFAKGESRPTLSEAHERYGDCICTTTRHSMAVTNGALRDTADRRTYEWHGDCWGCEEARNVGEAACVICGRADVHNYEPIARERKAMSVFALRS